MKKTFLPLVGMWMAAMAVSAAASLTPTACKASAKTNEGIIGFANVEDLGCAGVTGGMDGPTVHVATYDDLARYCQQEGPLTIVIDSCIEGGGKYGVKDKIFVASDKTLVGAPGVVLDGISFEITDRRNLIFRNIRLTHGKPDGLAFRNCHHVWVDHCDLSTCDDGLLDFTMGSSYMSVSWSAFHDHDKVSLACSGTMHYEDNFRNRVSFHHNEFYHAAQRNPRIGYGLGHLWNNYWHHNEYQGRRGYCVGFFNQAKVLVENSCFADVKDPFHNMYGEHEYDAHWAWVESKGNRFAPDVEGDKKGLGRSFKPSFYYDYTFACESAKGLDTRLPKQIGPQDWVVEDVYGFPGNGAIHQACLDSLKWSSVEQAQGYELYLGTRPRRLRCVQRGLERRYALTNLKPSTTYYWKVKTLTADGRTLETALWRFTTAAAQPTKPTLATKDKAYAVYEAYPSGQAVFSSSRGVATQAGKFSWAPVLGAVSYRVFLGESRATMQEAGQVEEPTFQPSEPLRLGHRYFWRVEALNAQGEAVSGRTWKFTAPYACIGEGMTEAENLLLFGQVYPELEDGVAKWKFEASNHYVVCVEAGTGTVAAAYRGREGFCYIHLRYFDEQRGRGRFQLRVNNRVVDSFVGDRHSGALEEQSFDPVYLRKGDQLAFDLLMNDKMRCRLDAITIEWIGE